MNDRERMHLSKFMSLVLRHRAKDFGLALDAEGFVPFDVLVALIEKQQHLTAGRAEVIEVIEHQRPKRFELRGDLIRATYGHSARRMQSIEYPPIEPPETLFHGTNQQALYSIRKVGLRSMARQYVHLSTSIERAQTVASRRTPNPIILTIRSKAAYDSGIVFHSPEPQHFLAKEIPPEFIVFPETTSQ
jgi:putative RNA 2'-phosphotransferase